MRRSRAASAANFYYGIRLLPPERRRAMCAVYAFARRVDDIGDGQLAREEKLRRLDEQAERTRGGRGGTRSGDGRAGGRVARFEVPLDALEALIEGVRMDVEGVSYESFDELVLYCRCVAGAIGRACLAIFGLRDRPDRSGPGRAARRRPRRGAAADEHPARPARGRPERARVSARATTCAASADARRRAAPPSGLAAGGSGAEARRRRPAGCDAELCALMRFQAERARGWFDRGMALAPLLDRRSAACVLAMAGIYGKLLDAHRGRPRARAARADLAGMHEKAWVAARSMLGGSG